MIASLFKGHAENSIAIRAPSQAPMTFGALNQQISTTVTGLNNVGIGHGDRVATVLANGPIAATAFLSVAAGTSAAPLNSGYTRDEFEFYLQDLEARCLVVEAGSDTTAIEAAQTLSIPVITLEPTGNAAGQFILNTDGMPNNPLTEGAGFATPDGESLVLHTSGTTGRPKIVPLTASNLMTSTNNIVESLALNSDDRGLGIMPLFHIHGLMATVAAPLAAGGSVLYTPKFNARRIIGQMDEARPTWYSGVPTMHQAILDMSSRGNNAEAIAGFASDIRFVRSASAALSPTILAQLEEVFPKAVVVEAYAMTEAAHQMTSNPVDRAKRRPGTVGIATGETDVRIMNPNSEELLPAGSEGDIVIRGGNVTSGYHNNPEANGKDFTSNGWFRTGDTGFMSGDGYLTLVARTKEIINRGGEKIAPVEVDNAILTHPAVAEAATFGIPNERWGEIVGTAIVLQEGQELDTKSLQKFLREKLADFKIPSEVQFVDEIPKGPTGKLQRIGMHQQFDYPDLDA